MTRKDLLQRGLGLFALGGLGSLAPRAWAWQQALPIANALAIIDTDELTLTQAETAAIRPILQPLMVPATPKHPRAATESGNDRAALAKRALLALATVLYGAHQREKADKSGESVESFRARLEKELASHELTKGRLWRFERMLSKFMQDMSGGQRRRQRAGGKAPSTGTPRTPEQAYKELLREIQKLTLRLVDVATNKTEK
jgi:hypothetical protein